MSFWKELSRRNVLKVGVAYAVAAWLIIHPVDIVLGNLNSHSRHVGNRLDQIRVLFGKSGDRFTKECASYRGSRILSVIWVWSITGAHQENGVISAIPLEKMISSVSSS
jgi:hypothetical protein